MKALISLRGCTGWSGPSPSAYPRRHVFAWRGPYHVTWENILSDISVQWTDQPAHARSLIRAFAGAFCLSKDPWSLLVNIEDWSDSADLQADLCPLSAHVRRHVLLTQPLKYRAPQSTDVWGQLWTKKCSIPHLTYIFGLLLTIVVLKFEQVHITTCWFL